MTVCSFTGYVYIQDRDLNVSRFSSLLLKKQSKKYFCEKFVTVASNIFS